MDNLVKLQRIPCKKLRSYLDIVDELHGNIVDLNSWCQSQRQINLILVLFYIVF